MSKPYPSNAEVKSQTPYVILSTRENIVCGGCEPFTEAPSLNSKH